MSMAINYQDVLSKLQVHGLDTRDFKTGGEKAVRCYADGEKGKKGWYWLHEIPFENGDIVIVGSYGIWHGQDNGAIKLPLPKGVETSKEDAARIRQRIADNRKRMALELKASQAKAASKALQKWTELKEEGQSGYLERKKVRASGVKFTSDGAVVVPMRDVKGKLHGLQFILDRKNEAHKPKIAKMDGSDKRFWPSGLAMKSHFHTIGRINPIGVNIITEGYATGDTLNDASGLGVAVCYSANNMQPVLKALAAYYPKAKWLFAADDDYLCRCIECKKQTLVADKACRHCNQDHAKQNTGIMVAMRSVLSVDSAAWFIPRFLDRQGKKLTDFNDLMMVEGIAAVASQVKDTLQAKFPDHGLKSTPSKKGAENRGAGRIKLASILNLDEAVARFSLVFDAKDMVYDDMLRKMIPIQSMKHVLPDHASRDWKAHPERQVILLDDITFDATEKTKKRCNMWGGFPTDASDKGSCDKILEMVTFLCSAEKNRREVLHQVLCFLAYPLQNHGAKLDMCLLFQGVPGTGKNLLFEDIMMEIYEQYSVIVGQSDVESQFNGWASKKLFVVADEVIAKRDLYQVPGKIKNLITGTHIPIRTLFTPTYQELNQINFVFLSNEVMPMVVEDKDRRFLVVKTPDKPMQKGFYDAVGAELKRGGIEAFHHFLLNYDVKAFNKNTRPLVTRSKEELIDLCKPAPVRFHDAWQEGRGLDTKHAPLKVPYCLCATDDLYRAFRKWCSREGETYIPSKNQFVSQVSFLAGLNKKRVRICSEYRFLNDGSNELEVKGERVQVRCIEPVESGNDFDERYGALESATVQVLQFRRAVQAGDQDE